MTLNVPHPIKSGYSTYVVRSVKSIGKFRLVDVVPKNDLTN